VDTGAGVGVVVGGGAGVRVVSVGWVGAWLAGVTGSDGVTGTDGVSTAAGSGAVVSDGAAGDSTVIGVIVCGSAGASMVGGEERTLEAGGDGGGKGGENSARPGPVVYQSSKPGATTPMSGIASGPGTSWNSMAAVDAGASAFVRPPALASGSTVGCAMASNDATVSAVAPAPRTEVAREGRCGAS
jgi:hypothetical protein